MKQALILIDEINRKQIAIKNTRSRYLINDYSKRIRDDIQELKDYCEFRGLDFQALSRKIIS